MTKEAATRGNCENGVLRNFTKFTRKHLCQSLFWTKVAGLRPAISSKIGSGTGVCDQRPTHLFLQNTCGFFCKTVDEIWSDNKIY